MGNGASLSLVGLGLFAFSLSRWVMPRWARRDYDRFPRWYRDLLRFFRQLFTYNGRSQKNEPWTLYDDNLKDDQEKERYAAVQQRMGYVVSALMVLVGLLGLASLI